MKLLRLTVQSALLMLVAAGALAQNDARPPVAVYDSTQIALSRYMVIKRLWVEGWKSSLWVGGDRDEATARRALLDQAARLGADGVINLYCLSQTDAVFSPKGYYCYGAAIKLKPDSTALK
jgi:hypothetical protein